MNQLHLGCRAISAAAHRLWQRTGPPPHMTPFEQRMARLRRFYAAEKAPNPWWYTACPRFARRTAVTINHKALRLARPLQPTLRELAKLSEAWDKW